jgi:hypothetical protein
MKAKVIIENGETEVILTPENDFEKDIIENIADRKKDFNIHTTAETNYSYSQHSNHKIVMNIKETRP